MSWSFVLVCSVILAMPKARLIDPEGVARRETTALFTSNFSQVTIPAGPHPFPFRTRPLSLPGPMIVDKAKVGRCLGFLPTARSVTGSGGLFLHACPRSRRDPNQRHAILEDLLGDVPGPTPRSPAHGPCDDSSRVAPEPNQHAPCRSSGPARCRVGAALIFVAADCGSVAIRAR